MRCTYPILLDVHDRLIVIIGGGAVAARKAAGLLEAGATRVRVISPDFDPAMPGAVERVPERFQPRHLEGAGLVFAATDSPAVNAQVVAEARALGLWTNRADPDDEEPGDFVLPARFSDGSATVAVSAGSPALSAAVRDDLRRAWDARWARLADVMQTLRPRIIAQEPPDRRRAMLRTLATAEARDVLAQSGPDGLTDWLSARFPR